MTTRSVPSTRAPQADAERQYSAVWPRSVHAPRQSLASILHLGGEKRWVLAGATSHRRLRSGRWRVPSR